MTDFGPSQFNTLKTIKFIPTMCTVSTTGRETTVLMAPKEVYFGGGSNSARRAHFSQLFMFVDFGERAKTFLRSCGVADEPSPDEVCSSSVARRSCWLTWSAVDCAHACC